MIYIVDVCKAWTHEECSAGMITLIKESLPDEQIVLCAEPQHIQALKNVGIPEKIKTVTVEFPQMNTVTVLKYVYDLKLRRLFRYLRPGDYVFSLASEKPFIEAMYRYCKKYNKVKFFLVLHGTMELVLEQQRLPQRLKNMNLTKQKGWRKKLTAADDAFFTIDGSIRKSECYSNIRFIVYGPRAIDEFRHVFADDIIKKFMFLHIPMPSYNAQEKTASSGKIRIGVWGNCVNDNAYKIISYVNKKAVCGDYEFVVLKKNRSPLKERLKNTKICVPGGDGFTREQMRSYLQNFDYALIPYERNKYRVSCSGVLADAIAYGIPVFALECAPCSYYSERFHIGTVQKSVKFLGDEIVRVIETGAGLSMSVDTAVKMHRENIDILRRNLWDESSKSIKQ